MLVIDFLQLIQDLRRQTQFFYQTPTQKWACGPISVITIKEQPCLVIQMTTQPRSLQQWELTVLLNKPDYLNLPVYLQIEQQLIAVYGFRLTNGEAWIS
ncbi:hypothetical protein [Lapidilactobacillus luobeiensis]|uniref:hypothetical protein n=1 Tax=Lapidilactobacillus luobeiensis TaxID=2950371 RepID=UPI0021C46D7D|nr:hypothetical protein [Lapidilactobacillus luobeiensis]